MKNLLISLTLLAALVVDSNAQTTIYDTFVTNGNPVGWSQDPTNKFYDPVNEDSQISQGNQCHPCAASPRPASAHRG